MSGKRGFVRQIYLSVPLAEQSPAAWRDFFEGAPQMAAEGTRGPVGSSFSFSRQYKIATYRGKPHLLVVEYSADRPNGAAVLAWLQATGWVVHHREYCFRWRPPTEWLTYHLFGYVPFQQRQYHRYQHAPSLTDRSDLLQTRLQLHLELLARELGRSPARPAGVRELHVLRRKVVHLGGAALPAFDLRFDTRLFIPEFLGLGRGAAQGLGVVRRADCESNA